MARGDGWLTVRRNITHELSPPDAQCERKAMREKKCRHNPHEAHTTYPLTPLPLSLSRTSERRNRWGTQPPLAGILDANIALDRRFRRQRHLLRGGERFPRRILTLAAGETLTATPAPSLLHASWRQPPGEASWQPPCSTSASTISCANRDPCSVAAARILLQCVPPRWMLLTMKKNGPSQGTRCWCSQ
jgi:hypothetical protein